ncbi:sulfotransferase [Rhizobium sp. TRM95111]|uniref:sulfotransferase n=1 Tax=Rhizobium alarense TaxID=2846851 RepID=UPI001F1AA045|nr:sulfotransferase [Rhizobium alarense]MCF3638362.1 sulfotransferase [Rhizobium alarense]
MPNKRFILGVGAQKAGTTWLYDYLARSGEVSMSKIKELHYFDAIYCPELLGKKQIEPIEKLKQRRIKDLKAGKTKPSRMSVELFKRIQMDFDDGAYIRYFQEIGRKSPVTGEITPSYSVIPAEGFRKIRSLLTSNGYDVRVVFLMRDPVERVYSALRMADRDVGTSRAFKGYFKALANDQHVLRSRYDKTLANLRAAFKPEEIHTEFYESLFTNQAVKGICDFLGISFKDPNFAVKKNASAKTSDLDKARIDAGIAAFRDVYDFAHREFGARVPAEWHA